MRPARTTPEELSSPLRFIPQPSFEELIGVVHTSPSSPERQHYYERTKSAGKQARSELPRVVAALRGRLFQADPLALLGSLHALDAMRRASLTAPENFGSDAALEFFAGLLTSEPETDLLPLLGQLPPHQLVLDTEKDLRMLAHLQYMANNADVLGSDDTPHQGTLNLLNFEQHFDRMSGFDVHVRRIADEVFAWIDDLAEDEVGFRLSDGLRFADMYCRARMSHSEQASAFLDAHYPGFDPDADPDATLQWQAGHMLTYAKLVTPPLELLVNDRIAEELGISVESFEKMLRSMATQLGSQHVTDLSGANAVRSRPILQLSSGEWFWCRPVDFIHGVFDWALEVVRVSPALSRRFDKARQRVAEQLPGRLLAEVFGDRVHTSVIYPAEETDTEADVVIALPRATVVVECKGGRFSPAGRRAAPQRVKRHAEDLITKAADQNARTMAAIVSGKRFRTSQGANLRLDFDTLLPIVVTFDRIDPFGVHYGTPSGGDLGRRSWHIALADLVAITDVLADPAEFIAYAITRVRQVQAGNVRVFVEADALGAWCVDRLNRLAVIPGSYSRRGVDEFMVSKTSSWMNDYFGLVSMQTSGATDDELERLAAASHKREAERRPSPCVPAIVLDALRRLLEHNDASWLERAAQTFAIRPSEWRHLAGVMRSVCADERELSRQGRKRRRRATSGYVFGASLPIRVRRISDPPPSDARHLDLVVDPSATPGW